MAKFKVGDFLLATKTATSKGLIGRVKDYRGKSDYIVSVDVPELGYRGYTLVWGESSHGLVKVNPKEYHFDKKIGEMVHNSRAFNSVRGNTKLKTIDYWFADNGYGDDTLIRYVQSYKKNRCIDFVDRYADTDARDKFYDAMYELTGIKNRWALNSRACNSSNPVVRNAMNAKVSMNSVDAKDKEEMAKFFKLMNDTISEISRLDMEFASYIKGLLNKAEKTQDKDLADWLQKANLEWKNLKIKGKIMR